MDVLTYIIVLRILLGKDDDRFVAYLNLKLPLSICPFGKNIVTTSETMYGEHVKGWITHNILHMNTPCITPRTSVSLGDASCHEDHRMEMLDDNSDMVLNYTFHASIHAMYNIMFIFYIDQWACYKCLLCL